MSDIVLEYGKSQGWEVRAKNVLVEGTTDVSLFQLAAKFELKNSGCDLLDKDLSIFAAGLGDGGGTHAVVRQLNTLRSISKSCLLSSGRSKYRFIGLFDDDKSGRGAVKMARQLDSSIYEYADLFRLQPAMPTNCNLNPKTLASTFEKANQGYKGLDWELEDLIDSDFIECFLSENPNALQREPCTINQRTHRDFTRDGKYSLHRFVKTHATKNDLLNVISALKAIRFYLNLPIR